MHFSLSNKLNWAFIFAKYTLKIVNSFRETSRIVCIHIAVCTDSLNAPSDFCMQQSPLEVARWAHKQSMNIYDDDNELAHCLALKLSVMVDCLRDCASFHWLVELLVGSLDMHKEAAGSESFWMAIMAKYLRKVKHICNIDDNQWIHSMNPTSLFVGSLINK